jgi:hypothetical protein
MELNIVNNMLPYMGVGGTGIYIDEKIDHMHSMP